MIIIKINSNKVLELPEENNGNNIIIEIKTKSTNEDTNTIGLRIENPPELKNEKWTIYTDGVDVAHYNGDIYMNSFNCLYLAGDKLTDGSWRIFAQLYGNLKIQRREGGFWKTKFILPEIQFEDYGSIENYGSFI